MADTKTPEEIAAEKLAAEETEKQEKAEVETLRVEARALGVTVDNRWGADRLRKEIADASTSAPEPQAPEYVAPLDYIVLMPRLALHYADTPQGQDAEVVTSGTRVTPKSDTQFRALQLLQNAGHVRAVART